LTPSKSLHEKSARTVSVQRPEVSLINVCLMSVLAPAKEALRSTSMAAGWERSATRGQPHQRLFDVGFGASQRSLT